MNLRVLFSAALMMLVCSPSMAERCLTLHQARKIWPTQHLVWQGRHCWSNRRGKPKRDKPEHHHIPARVSPKPPTQEFSAQIAPLWPPALVPHGMDLMAAITREVPPRVITRIVREEVPVPDFVNERDYDVLDAEEDMREMRSRERVRLMAIAAWFGAATVMGGAALWGFVRRRWR